MRKIFCFLYFLFVYAKGYSQNWAPTGSIWHYGILESFFSQDQGYLKVESIGDTLIQGNQCKILHKTRFNAFTHALSDEGDDYMYSQNNMVYHFMNDTFYTLYNFNAMPGDTWTVAVPYPSPWNSQDTLVNIVVDSTSIINIQGNFFNTQYVHSVDNDWYFLNPIISSIGSMGGMFPFIYGYMDIEIPFFRCYEDTTFFYQRSISFPCDTVIDSMRDLINNTKIEIYPNPASDIIYVKIPLNKFGSSKFDLKIYDTNGILILTRDFDFKNQEDMKIKINDFSNGVYEILLFNENSNTVLKGNFIITHNYH